MATFYLKRRDTRPTMEVYLLDPGGTAHDLSGATSVTLHVLLNNGQSFSRAMAAEPVGALGIVRYTWPVTDWYGATPLVAGSHRMEYEVVGPTTARMSFPNDGYDELRVTSDIGHVAMSSPSASPSPSA